jgi:hypothetical protein
MSWAITFTVDDAATPILTQLRAGLEDARALHEAIGAEAEILTRDHIGKAAPSRHKTAQRLGAEPTGYYERTAEGVTSRGDDDAAVVVIGGDNAIFARVFGPVTVKPRTKKFLTVPAKAAAYGKRAGEIPDLDVLFFNKGGGRGFSMALGRRDDDGKADVWFWLVRQVTLPQDRGLLPTDDQYSAAAELGAIGYLDAIAGDSLT